MLAQALEVDLKVNDIELAHHLHTPRANRERGLPPPVIVRFASSDRRKYPSREYNQNMEVIDEFAVTLSRRRSSISNSTVPTGMALMMLMEVAGSMMLMEEEDEDEVFNSKHLEDLKAGRCEPHGEQSNKRRLTELQVRNSLCLPHLKSSYPAETQFHLPRDLKEDDIKLGLPVDIDPTISLLQNTEKGKRRDKNQYRLGYNHACNLDAATRPLGMLLVPTSHASNLVAAFYDQLSWYQGVKMCY
uniref:Uncharacterized protein n=1 Tax=Timema poppense TaxID=170557 RepID=A0A7R9CWJ5_TIMPO|nr:unnamed protein product [Timema poppensis]